MKRAEGLIKHPQSLVYNMDCMEGMKEYPDKYFDLVLADPPYGINAEENAHLNGIKCRANGFKEHSRKTWDNAIPTAEYFTELFRVSKNQIICGANYFPQYLPPSMGWVFWYKMQKNFSFSDGEFIFTSFQTKGRIFEYARGGASGFSPMDKFDKNNIHPTQKPKSLYRYLLKHYAKAGDKILDTHLGSGSSRIACYEAGYDFTGYELDADYFKASEERFQKYISQGNMFREEKKPDVQEVLL